jgi:hypothetical protein
VKGIFPEYYLGNEIKESEVGGIAQGCTEFPKIWGPFHNSEHHNGDKKQVPH